MTIAKVYRATVSKDIGIPGSNEDTYCLRLRETNPRAAVFDGASESFAARKWSRQLAEEWGRPPTRDWSWVEKAQERYTKNISNMELSWAQEAAVQRGSYSTIAYILFDDNWLEFSAVGDSNIFLISGASVRFSYPYVFESQFTSAPTALSSNLIDKRQNIENLLTGMSRIQFKALETSHILLATDAISAWLLNQDEELRIERLRELMSCSTVNDFKDLVIKERATHAMKIDDSTVVLLELS